MRIGLHQPWDGHVAQSEGYCNGMRGFR